MDGWVFLSGGGGHFDTVSWKSILQNIYARPSTLDQCDRVLAAPVVTSAFRLLLQFDFYSVGVIGVIGPTRMAYERIIPIVDVTAKLLGSALNSRL